MFVISKGLETLIESLKANGVEFENEPNCSKPYWHHNSKHLYLVQQFEENNIIKLNTTLNITYQGKHATEVILDDNLANLSKAARDKRITITHQDNYAGCEHALVINRK